MSLYRIWVAAFYVNGEGAAGSVPIGDHESLASAEKQLADFMGISVRKVRRTLAYKNFRVRCYDGPKRAEIAIFR